ncbi:MAG: hypothetical protein FWE23_08815 [Chitinivibrionia bacterium]|nr:hypothetical protein [Chitinivibrionia bacterium]
MKDEERVCGDCGSIITPDETGARVSPTGWHCTDCAKEQEEEPMSVLAAMYNDVSSQIKTLEKKKDALKEAIYARLGDNLEATDGHYRVVRKVVFSSRFDSSKFKEENKELAEKYTVKTSSERLTVELAF